MEYTLIIFPVNQYDIRFIKKTIKDCSIKKIILYEHPFYFTKYKFHKLKLAFLRASFKNYFLELKKSNLGISINYIEFKDLLKLNQSIIALDPIDFPVKDEIIKTGAKIISDTPHFLIKQEDLYSINIRRHSAFYRFSKMYIKDVYSIDFTGFENQDVLNRKRIPKDVLENLTDKFKVYDNTNSIKKEAINYINNHFSKNFGLIDNLKHIPISRSSSKKFLKDFMSNKLRNFGDYQDFISKDNVILFHSMISVLLNVGLLSPLDVIVELDKYKFKFRDINSFEGFLRQIIGWREYMRYMYVKDSKKLVSSNSWNNNGFIKFPKIKEEILLVEMEKIRQWGWAHHIIRLMVFLNYFVLSGVSPKNIYIWFMEHIALDAYDWVMVPNIYAMGYFNKEYTSRSYISSSNYLRKMSDYSISELFTQLYRKRKN
jgi:deoxyribodipyrimidine photolyase-related protein